MGTMLISKSFRVLAVALSLGAACAMAHAAEKGYFGFAMSIDSEGFSFNPVLRSVTVDRVTPASPAEAAGLVKGDQFVEVEGRQVAGAKANDIKPYLSKNVGESVNLKVKKASGDVVAITMTAAKKP